MLFVLKGLTWFKNKLKKVIKKNKQKKGKKTREFSAHKDLNCVQVSMADGKILHLRLRVRSKNCDSLKANLKLLFQMAQGNHRQAAKMIQIALTHLHRKRKMFLELHQLLLEGGHVTSHHLAPHRLPRLN